MTLGASLNHKTFKFLDTILSVRVWEVQLVISNDFGRKKSADLGTSIWNFKQVLN